MWRKWMRKGCQGTGSANDPLLQLQDEEGALLTQAEGLANEEVGPGLVRPVVRLNSATFTGNTSFAANYNPNTNTGTWTEVRVKVDGTLGAFFVNGSPAGIFTAPTGLSNNIPLWMGAMHQAPSGMIHCEIDLDEVRLSEIPGGYSQQ